MSYLIIKTYDDLGRYVRAFRRKHIGLLIIVSRAGLGKTSLVEEELEIEAPLVFNSHVTPLSFYQALAERTAEESDCLIVIDEAEMMFQNSKLKTMLKLLCDTRKEKIIKYMSTTPLLKGLPKEITSKAKVIMLINTLIPSDENIRAIMSRGHTINFEPPDSEIFNYLNIGKWAEDKEVINFIRGYAPLSRALTLRTYVKAVESKKSNLDWEAEIMTELELDHRLLTIQRLFKNYKRDGERLKQWIAETGEGQATYYRYRKIYLSKVLGRKSPEDEKEEIT